MRRSKLVFHHDWSTNYTEVYTEATRMDEGPVFQPKLSRFLHLVKRLGIFETVVADNVVEFEFKRCT